ncbi:short-chain dehydrogenase reductase family [Lecanosticta acicola]|uniref:Short-chain dehydrogenase reductase family n=1 Tax=Lecanosticta acicola TaxID=111012 RepID=A0AAI8Z506_9PEZI|nr:short-chain dehydrogenase reductase family [Lecanosticta acicola]
MASHVTSGPDKPWYHHITLDLFVKVLSNSLFHPFVAWIVPLCLRAVQAPYDSTEFVSACVYASCITLLWMLSIVNNRVAYGLPREMDWDEEVVVITGGASGLGKTMAEMYGMRGASVAIIDIAKPEKESDGLAGVQAYQCDVGDAEALERVKEQIEKDLGTPTILINNAGVVNGKPIWELSARDVQRNFNVNLLSHFNTIRTFLPGMLKSETGGTIVTVASVLGKLGASYLSDYTAAKAGLIAMHKSLRAEMASPTAPEGAENIRMVLVTPGQLATPLFAEVETPSNFMGPLVEPVELAREIVKIVDAGESGEVGLPFYTRYVDWAAVLPVGLERLVRWISGMDRAMEKVHAKRSAKVK